MTRRIVIDGDGCPVKNEAIDTATALSLPVTIVTSFAHFTPADTPPLVTYTYVDGGMDAADFRIMSMITSEDIVITQDYGLASLALGKGATVLNQRGWEYTPENIDQLLEERYQNGKARKQGKRTKGPKPFTQNDRQHFASKLAQVLKS